jgi:chromosome segregation ATPase
MPSQEVITALESLHRELDKLEPAIKHVELAQQVTQTLKDIPIKHIELINELKDTDIRYKVELNEIFSNELIALTEQTKALQKTTSDIQQQIQSDLETLKQLQETVQNFHEKVAKINFPERLDRLDANVAGIMAAVQSVQSRLDGMERNLTDRLKDMAEYQKKSHTTLQEVIHQLHSTIQALANKQQMLSYITWGLVTISMIATYFFNIK